MGEGSYDSAQEREQAIVAGTCDEQLEDRLVSLELEQKLPAAGVEWVEADDDGNPVTPGA